MFRKVPTVKQMLAKNTSIVFNEPVFPICKTRNEADINNEMINAHNKENEASLVSSSSPLLTK